MRYGTQQAKSGIHSKKGSISEMQQVAPASLQTFDIRFKRGRRCEDNEECD